LLVTPAILGNYVVAAAVGALPLLVPSAVSLVLYPIFARQPMEQADRAFARFILLAILLSGAAAPVVIIVNPLVVKVFFGSGFGAAVIIAQILGVASLFRGMSAMVASVLRGMGAPIRASSGDIFGLIVMAIVLVPGILLAQGEGAAVAALLSAASALSWMTYQSLRVVRMSPSDLVQWWRVDFGRGMQDESGAK
jgi:O-antigen/teichoic acid export membrane protein